MKIFYTGSDIEELAASGVTRLEIGPGVQTTDVARQLAAEMGIELVRSSEAPVSQRPPVSQPASAPSAVVPLPAKPRGCQHGSPQRAASPSAASGNHRSGQDGVVNRLVNIMNQLTDRGG